MIPNEKEKKLMKEKKKDDYATRITGTIFEL